MHYSAALTGPTSIPSSVTLITIPSPLLIFDTEGKTTTRNERRLSRDPIDAGARRDSTGLWLVA